ncbi:bifunctional proline dehydrogenase/L-glutamate gamma-semialdehyde dehydrogenase [Thioalkalivibrio denitrificans]|uniref:Bifunctional protein PutA n=1 Tax=Thioalkalivibrio denitrificans TaxID=108003 RepID=A0A1V3NLG7_9GAMM|nr:bifunctional proline dehydrogenase/L-glutamate gamma-semialdehyde dehydrogenase PutA [Thioalkalivibrio denitrificans]OOG25900.1 bifunctional proline dehydrogenase/L-glutamate gamma-semialdehyde dehydrogenase [Thioalkalivibrio denitrificans]
MAEHSDTEELRLQVRRMLRTDEVQCVLALASLAETDTTLHGRISERAAELVHTVRSQRSAYGGVDALMHEYDLSSHEGIVLMCLAEALMRVPDAQTADLLIRDKLSAGDWASHLGHSESLLVNASTWGLMLTGRVVNLDANGGGEISRVMRRLVQRSGETVIRGAIRQAMGVLARQFVTGRTIEEALARTRDAREAGIRQSFDMLGEAARTDLDAVGYHAAYAHAIDVIARQGPWEDVHRAPGISVKLSALHPRYEFAQRERVLPVLVQRLGELAVKAAEANIGLCVDAEEADRLDISLDVIEAVSACEDLAGWQGLGLAVQAYQKRCAPLIAWLTDMARRHDRRLMVRLVKGAYWDSEIKLAQEQGFADYPVFTRKVNTDVSYLACARLLLQAEDCIYPQFATHNAHTAAWVGEMAGERPFEYQRLHGMGEALHRALGDRGAPCRVYAPVGSHEALLPYLVRRLLENGANTSFVNRLQDDRRPVEVLVRDPVRQLRNLDALGNPRIPAPPDLYGAQRRNALGRDLADPLTMERLARQMEEAARTHWRAAPLIDGVETSGDAVPVTSPADRRQAVGDVVWATEGQVAEAASVAERAFKAWDGRPVAARAACLERMADLMERHMPELMGLCVREAGKTLPDSVAEVREAVDFCRYYAMRALADFGQGESLHGPTGESNRLSLHGRGVFACISPWNFPLAIFCGQVAAALAAGNCVVAKPAEQTPLIAARAVHLFHEAGMPAGVLQLLPGDGSIGAALVRDDRIGGVAFTGSLETAQAIHRALAARAGPIIPLIAETGGINAMIADSTALPEQLVVDVMASAFRSAGQRCSALRVLYLQEELAPRFLDMLSGAMEELVVGDPARLCTDVGPVIDEQARDDLLGYIDRQRQAGRPVLGEGRLGEATEHGLFIPPVAFGISGIEEVEREIFGPVLHVARYRARDLDAVIEAINASGYGLTLGIHTRIDSVAESIASRVRVGNCYVNRNQVGAVVGVQPFGGEGLSGTGPKAGGPRYLHRFATERVVTINTAATGGNASLFSLDDDES